MILRCLAVSFFYRALSERHLLGNGDGLAIAHSCDVTNQASFLIGHANFHRGNLRMVSHIHSLSAKHIAFLGARHKHDAVADAEGQLSAAIHQGCYRQVGQGKQCPTLTNVSTISATACCSSTSVILQPALAANLSVRFNSSCIFIAAMRVGFIKTLK